MAEPERSIEYVLARFLYKEDVQELCEDLNLPVTGSKDHLISNLLEDEDFDPSEALAYLDKEELETLCDEWELADTGTRETLIRRVLKELEKGEQPAPPRGRIEAPQPPPPPPPPEGWVPPQPEISSVPIPPAYVRGQEPGYRQTPLSSGILPPAYGAPPGPSPHLEEVLEFIRFYQSPQPFRDEQRYKDSLAAAIAQKFGSDSVRQEMPITGGRIDIDLYFQIGIELKFPTSQGDLDRLAGQAQKYQRHYGPNLIVVLFAGGYNQRDLAACRNWLERIGVKAFLK